MVVYATKFLALKNACPHWFFARPAVIFEILSQRYVQISSHHPFLLSSRSGTPFCHELAQKTQFFFIDEEPAQKDVQSCLCQRPGEFGRAVIQKPGWPRGWF
jgi:hypothetical protein